MDCLHTSKGVDLVMLKKNLKKNNTVRCEKCYIQKSEVSEEVLLCLKCGYRGCEKNLHALEHFNNSVADNHAFSLNITTLSVWCYVCTKEVCANRRKKLQECVDFIKSHTIFSNFRKNKIERLPQSAEPLLAPRGLINLGCTCYFNTVIQCLSHTPLFAQALKNTCIELETLEKAQNVKSGSMKVSPLTRSLGLVVKEILNGNAQPYCPKQFHSVFIQKKPQFKILKQHDSHHYLRCLLTAIKEEKNSLAAELERNFDGVLEKSSECLDCKAIFYKRKTFSDLSLTIPKNASIQKGVTLDDCLNDFTRIEYLCDNNQVNCNDCKAPRNFRIRHMVAIVPETLILHIHRAQFLNNRVTKNTTFVSFPNMFDFKPYCCGLKGKEIDNEKVVYSLYGVIKHIQLSTDSGHYESYIKTRFPVDLDSNRKKWIENKEMAVSLPGKWYHISDNVVKSVLEKTVFETEATILFYEHIL